MKNANLPKISFIILILCGLFFNNANAGWTCGRPCPSSIFSGKLECELAQAGCPIRQVIVETAQDIKTNTIEQVYKINVKNNTAHPIKVHVEWYVQGPPNQDSCLAHVGAGCPDNSYWNQNSYWDFQPGESAFLVRTKNRTAYFSAESLDGSGQWPVQQVDMGKYYNTFTYTFNP